MVVVALTQAGFLGGHGGPWLQDQSWRWFLVWHPTLWQMKHLLCFMHSALSTGKRWMALMSIISVILMSRGSLSGISTLGSSSASSVSCFSFAAASSALSLAVCLSISSCVRGCAWEKVDHSDWTGFGVSSLSKNPPVVSLSVLSRVESDGGWRIWHGVEIQKQLEDDMVGNSLLLDSRR